MSTETPSVHWDEGLAQQVLRIALAGALGIALPTLAEVPMPFVGAVFAVTFAAAMRQLPPFGVLLVLIAIAFIVPALFTFVSSIVLDYPYLLVAFIWLTLFVGFRMQTNPRQKLLGVLTVLFAIAVPIINHSAEEIGPLFAELLGLNVTAALVSVVIAFAVFPNRGGAAAAPAPAAAAPALAPGEDVTIAAINATVMTPMVVVFMSADAVTALRCLVIASTVLAAVGAEEEKRQSQIALLAVIIGGAAAIAVSTLWIVLPSPLIGVLLAILASLLIGRRALEGRHAPAYAAGIGAMWILLGTSGTEPAMKVIVWTAYAIIGSFYAIAGRALLNSIFRRQPPGSMVSSA